MPTYSLYIGSVPSAKLTSRLLYKPTTGEQNYTRPGPCRTIFILSEDAALVGLANKSTSIGQKVKTARTFQNGSWYAVSFASVALPLTAYYHVLYTP